MHSHSSLIYALISLAPLAARADLQLDTDDIAPACRPICRPVWDLSQTCDPNDDRVPSKQAEDALFLQCFCTNTSFDVADITGLCASCMAQNPGTGNDIDASKGIDDTKKNDYMADIQEIVQRCGFAVGSYTPAQSAAADGADVVATRPTESSAATFLPLAGGIVQSGPKASPLAAAPSPGVTALPSGATQPAQALPTTGTSSTSTGTSTSTPTPGPDSGATSAAAAGAGPVLGSWTVLSACAVGAIAMGLWA